MESSSPLATLLRRIGGGLPPMAPTFNYDGSGALDDDSMEDNNRWGGGGVRGLSSIDGKDDQMDGVMQVADDSMGRATAAASASASSATDRQGGV
jgi:hypothetical protein